MWIGYKSTACCWALVTIFLLCCQFLVVLSDMFFFLWLAIGITLVVITLIGKVLFKWFCCCKIVLLKEGSLLRRAFKTWGWRERAQVCKLIFIALVITKSTLQRSIVDGNSLHQKWWLSTLSPWTRDYNVNMHDWQHIKRWIFLSVKNFVLVLVEEMCVWSI